MLTTTFSHFSRNKLQPIHPTVSKGYCPRIRARAVAGVSAVCTERGEVRPIQLYLRQSQSAVTQ